MPKQKPGGRKLKLTSELTEKFCAHIEEGLYPTTACKLLNIAYITYTRWMARGEKREAPFATFYDAVHIAEAKAEEHIWANIKIIGHKDWKAWVKLLELRWPERYTPKTKVESDVKVTETKPKDIQDEIRKVAEEYEAILKGEQKDGTEPPSLKTSHAESDHSG